MRVVVAAVAVGCLVFSSGLASAQPDTTVVNPPPVPIPTEVTPPPMTITLPPPPPPVTTTVTAPPPPPVTTTVTLPPPPPVTTTVTVTPPPPTTTPPPPVCGGPINITSGGTYTGCYQSQDVATPAVRISTTQPVTLSRARIVAKGYGVWAYDVKGTQLTIRDSVFEQQDPGAVVEHRAVRVNEPRSFVFEFNRLTDTDGVLVHGLREVASQIDPLSVKFNTSVNIGRYPRPTGGGCCIQFLGLDNVLAPNGQVHWNHTRNVAGQSAVEDNIGFYISGGIDTTHRIDVGWNLIDGAYSRNLAVTNFTGGGINLGDGGGGSGFGGGGHNTAHDNIVVSTTNYGISVNANDNYANNNLLVNDGVEQRSEFGQAIVAWPEVTPPGLHATNSRYNWRRFGGDTSQWPCYVATYCQGTQVSTTEQQARDFWESQRALAGVTVGPRP